MKRSIATADCRSSQPPKLSAIAATLPPAGIGTTAPGALAATVHNPVCPFEEASCSPGNGEDIVIPPGFKVSVFAKDLNVPGGIASKGSKNNFQADVLESGHGLPSSRNDETSPAVGSTLHRWVGCSHGSRAISGNHT